MKIAVDFDGTCVDHVFPKVGKDAPNVVETLHTLVDGGHMIFLYTMRSGNFLTEAIKWFIDRNIPLSGINNDPSQSEWTQSPKCYADLYIDDLAFGAPLITPAGFKRRCIDWNAVNDKLLTLKTAAEIAAED